MEDMNAFGLNGMSRHRDAELNALLSANKDNLFEKNGIKLINYSDLINQVGLDKMKADPNLRY